MCLHVSLYVRVSVHACCDCCCRYSIVLLCHVILLQEQLQAQTIRHEIVRLWPEQGKLVHCAFGMLPTCGVGVGVYCMHLNSICVMNSEAYLSVCYIDYIQ